MDIGYALTRDACGKDSKPDEIARSWRRSELAKIMDEKVKEELESLKSKGKKVFTAEDEKTFIAEIREKPGDRLVSYYEIKEITQQ